MCFGDAVGVEIDLVTLLKLELLFFVPNTFHTGQHEIGSAFQVFVRPVLMAYHRRIVTGIGIADESRFQIQNTHPGRDKHARLVVLAKLGIDLCEDVVDCQTALGMALDQRFGCHHKHGTGNTLTGNISNHKSQMVFIQQIEIVEVAANFLCCVHAGKDAEILAVGIGREDRGQC